MRGGGGPMFVFLLCFFFTNFGPNIFAKTVSQKVRKSKSETLDIQTHAYLTHQSLKNLYFEHKCKKH